MHRGNVEIAPRGGRCMAQEKKNDRKAILLAFSQTQENPVLVTSEGRRKVEK